MKIGIIGSSGFLGSAVAKFCEDSHLDSLGITKENYSSLRGSDVDVLVNCNGNSRKFWANANPVEDFKASVLSTYKSLFDFKFGKYVFVSTSDVYPNYIARSIVSENYPIDHKELTPYGLNKFIAESIVTNYCRKYLILRCAALIGRGLKKGVIKDIIDGTPLFLTLTSRLQFIGTQEVAKIILRLIETNVFCETFNISGSSNIEVKELARIFNKDVRVRPNAEEQFYNMSVDKIASYYPVRSSRDYVLLHRDELIDASGEKKDG
jgi:nucleoside-diphosphate-sugar epimerase